VRKAVKNVLARLIVESGLDAGLLRHSAVIVAFHRVHDGAAVSDSLTVDVSTFERYCRYFRRHFHVIPLRDLAARLSGGRAPSRELAITFDDGYRDNFENAAPVLERLSLPATFFVVTQWMDTDVVPFWDSQRGMQYPWMTWDQVRSLHRRGFDIGVHTRTHPDLGKTTGPAAEEEIRGARLELERQLGAPATSFAYPYGGPDHFTQENRERVKAAGFSCCCSGFGGINPADTDPFLLRRVPITRFYESPYQFGFDLALGRTTVSWPEGWRS
jgi:peptidoglycan/xylan/chitin deacetylase (PgdA/CDA1 family)